MDKTEKRGLSRRAFLETGAAAATFGVLGSSQAATAQPASAWNQGQLIHLIPTANHERFLIKASFKSPLAATPRLSVDGRSVEGVQTDPQGRFWRFDVSSLRPATEYQLRLTDPGGGPLCDAWPLKTFPAPAAPAERLRIVAYTCGGGYDGPPLRGKTTFLDMAARRRLLARAMSYQPDAVIANGDQIYWDMTTALTRVEPDYVKGQLWVKFGGALDLSVPMLHPKNAPIFTAVCDYQICGLYGTTSRSTPAFFLTDDHDTFENDEFDERSRPCRPTHTARSVPSRRSVCTIPSLCPTRTDLCGFPAVTRTGHRLVRILRSAHYGTEICWKPFSTTAGATWTTKAIMPKSFHSGPKIG